MRRGLLTLGTRMAAVVCSSQGPLESFRELVRTVVIAPAPAVAHGRASQYRRRVEPRSAPHGSGCARAYHHKTMVFATEPVAPLSSVTVSVTVNVPGPLLKM